MISNYFYWDNDLSPHTRWKFINQTSIIEWFSFTWSAELFQINIDGQAAMSGDENAAVLDGVVAADETQAHQERGGVS